MATAGLAVGMVLFIGASMMGSDGAIEFACTPYYPGSDQDQMASLASSWWSEDSSGLGLV